MLGKERQEQKDSGKEISENSFQERNSQPGVSKTYLLQSSCGHVSGIETQKQQQKLAQNALVNFVAFHSLPLL